jgi:polyisoprenyl-teichoic acid--peptidoglycan teichoic acid transferase
MKKIYAYALILLVISLVFTVVWGIFAAYQRPLGQPLAISQAQPTTVALAAKPEAKPEAKPQQPKEVCGQTGKMKLVVIGSDRTAGVAPYGADGVRLIQVDYTNRKVTIAAFTRDLEVRIKGLADKKVTRAPLGLAYHYKFTETSGTEKDKTLAGTNLIAEVLYDNYKLQPDHYLTTELQHFDSLVDAIGGIKISNPLSFVSDNGTTFGAGSLDLTGELAAEFMRTFKPGGDMARLQRQNIVMKGLREKLISLDMATKLPTLYDNFNKIVLTDLSLEQFNSLNCMLSEVPKEDIMTYEIGADERVTGPDGKLVEQPRGLPAILNSLFKD